ncbi:hypothetical protein ACWE42_10250 [Sutcliffiella cohnii]
MLNKIKQLPEKTSFIMGLSLILLSGILFFILSFAFTISSWIVLLMESVMIGVGFILIINASMKRHARNDR